MLTQIQLAEVQQELFDLVDSETIGLCDKSKLRLCKKFFKTRLSNYKVDESNPDITRVYKS